MRRLPFPATALPLPPIPTISRCSYCGTRTKESFPFIGTLHPHYPSTSEKNIPYNLCMMMVSLFVCTPYFRPNLRNKHAHRQIPNTNLPYEAHPCFIFDWQGSHFSGFLLCLSVYSLSRPPGNKVPLIFRSHTIFTFDLFIWTITSKICPVFFSLLTELYPSACLAKSVPNVH